MPSHEHLTIERAVCLPVPPFPTESARGYIARVADHNIHERHVDALSSAGVDLNEVMAGRVDAGLLDRIYGLETAGVNALWPQSLDHRGPSPVLVYGAELPYRFFRHHRRRVSVAGLRKSLHHRHFWAIEPLGFCPVSWDVLVEHCPECGHKLAWGNGAFWCCDACGIDLRLCQSVRIRREHRPALAAFSDLFSADFGTRVAARLKFPDFFRDVPLQTKVDFIRLLGSFFDQFGPADSQRPTLPRNYPTIMWVGLDVLLRLDHYSAALAQPSSQARAWQSELRARLRPLASGNNEMSRAVGGLLAILLPGYTPNVEVRTLRLGRAARQLRIGTARARQLVDLGLLPSCCTLGGGERRHDLLAQDAVAKLQAQLSDRISLNRLVSETGVSVGIIAALEKAGRLPTVDNELTRLLFTETQFHPSAKEELVALKRKVRLRDPSDPDCVRLSDLFSAMGIGFKPWTPVILEAAEAGELGTPNPWEMRKATLNVSLDWARRFARGRTGWVCGREIAAQSISLVEAEEYLNTLPKDTSCLIAHGQLQRGDTGVTASSVRRCGRLFISTREVAARAGIQSDQVAGLAARASVERPYRLGSFWPRDRIEAAFELPPSGWASVVSRALSLAQG
jgi:hypothetical protein